MASNSSVRPPRNRGCITRDQVRTENNTQGRMKCCRYGRWYGDHKSDGSHKLYQPLFDKPTDSAASSTNRSNAGFKAVAFNMSCVISNKPDLHRSSIPITGPMVDNGAPYRVIGYTELFALSASILPACIEKIDLVPNCFYQCPSWKYGVREHVNASRRISGSVLLHYFAPNVTYLYVRNFVLDGS